MARFLLFEDCISILKFLLLSPFIKKGFLKQIITQFKSSFQERLCSSLFACKPILNIFMLFITWIVIAPIPEESKNTKFSAQNYTL